LAAVIVTILPLTASAEYLNFDWWGRFYKKSGSRPKPIACAKFCSGRIDALKLNIFFC